MFYVNYDRLTGASTGNQNWWTGLQVAAALTDGRGMSSLLKESEKSRWSRFSFWIGADVGFVWKYRPEYTRNGVGKRRCYRTNFTSIRLQLVGNFNKAMEI